MLDNRYLDDRIPEWDLNPVHRKFRDAIVQKLALGKYRQEEVNVCLCGGTEFDRLSEKERFGLPFGTILCTSCGLIHASPRLHPSTLPEFYDQDYHGLVFGSERITDFEHMVSREQGTTIFNFLRPHLGQRKQLSIAEIGAGVGNNLKTIAEECAKIGIATTTTGCEYSQACVTFGKERYQLDLHTGGIEALQRLGRKFDLVILSHVLEHFPDPLLELKNISGILADLGMVYVEVPGVLDLHNKPQYQCDYLRYCVVAHMHNYALGTLTNVMGLGGFSLEQGTEFVRAIFRRGSSTHSCANYTHKVRSYLEGIERDHRVLFEIATTKSLLAGNQSTMKEKLREIDARAQDITQSARRLLELKDSEVADLRTRLRDLETREKASDEWFKAQIVRILEEKKSIEARLNTIQRAQSGRESLLQGEISSLKSQVASMRNELEELQRLYAINLNSLSWKLTAPLRKVKEMLLPGWKG